LVIFDSLFFSGSAGLVSCALARADVVVNVAATAIDRNRVNVLIVPFLSAPEGRGSLSISDFASGPRDLAGGQFP
jgi:hypothetical protein